MKTVVVTIADPTPGDMVIVEYSAKRGNHGETYIVLEGDTPAAVANAFADKIAVNWMKESFEARVSDEGQLVIGCLLPDLTFNVCINGDGATKISKMVL